MQKLRTFKCTKCNFMTTQRASQVFHKCSKTRTVRELKPQKPEPDEPS